MYVKIETRFFETVLFLSYKYCTIYTYTQTDTRARAHTHIYTPHICTHVYKHGFGALYRVV